MSASIHPATDRELVITRMLDAPRELVYKAWTRPEHIAHWLGPKGFSATFVQVDATPGGAYRFCIRSAEGSDYWIRGTFREVIEPSRLAFTWAWEDDDGRPGCETLVTVTLEARGGRTHFTFHQAAFESVESRDSHNGGWTECFDRLEAYLAER